MLYYVVLKQCSAAMRLYPVIPKCAVICLDLIQRKFDKNRLWKYSQISFKHSKHTNNALYCQNLQQ